MPANGSKKTKLPAHELHEYDSGLEHAKRQGTVHSFLEVALRREIGARAEAVTLLEDTGAGILTELQEFRTEVGTELKRQEKKIELLEGLLGNYAKDNQQTSARLEAKYDQAQAEYKQMHQASLEQETRYGELVRKISEDDAKDEQQEKEITGVKDMVVQTRVALESQHEEKVAGVTQLVHQTKADLERRYTLLKVAKSGIAGAVIIAVWEFLKRL